MFSCNYSDIDYFDKFLGEQKVSFADIELIKKKIEMTIEKNKNISNGYPDFSIIIGNCEMKVIGDADNYYRLLAKLTAYQNYVLKNWSLWNDQF